jgi:nuclear pore complex protein Nup160
MQIQEYVRLLSTWCDWNCHSRQFLLGSALLNMGEPDKACDWMIQAAGGVGSDMFLTSHLFNPEEIQTFANCTTDRMTVMYFLKIIHLFEQFGYYDHVIELAKTAIAICDDDDADRTTLCYTLFSYHLRLGHYDKVKTFSNQIAGPNDLFF